MKILLAFLISVIAAPIIGLIPQLLFLIPFLDRFLFTLIGVKNIGWFNGISSGVLQVWIISLIFKWITNSNPHFVFLIIFIFVEIIALGRKVNPGPLKLGFLVGTALGLIFGWLIFI